ncbi:hypothetical protein FJR11_22505 [Anabaena sp. UHCC 0187]|uniref:hypothetical protein n=1 Tax=Anabaena sp. UHCC 0187 TaxID=2590018 RepID=UPI0014472C37|nr:hypothetical protein [Anabaena sp. UHCC 0187]MTJ15283.1 hypothetical protein [Anabaena sp. UHCC 0187]
MANIPNLKQSNYHLEDIELMIQVHTFIFNKVKSIYTSATQTELISITNSLTSSFLINHAISSINLNQGDMESYLYGIQNAIDRISI